MHDDTRQIAVGAAVADFTPAPGLDLIGQMHRRTATHARDPLQANAVAWRQDGLTVVLVAVDICIMDNAFVQRVQSDFAAHTGLPGRALLLHATHTHVAPGVFTVISSPADPAFVAHLAATLVQVAARALAQLAPATLYAGTGAMAEMGWNRRAMFADGSSRMYGHADQPGFIGMEGPRDPALSLLWASDPAGAVRVVVVNFSTHPNCLEGESYYSADLPGEVRRQLRALLGPATVVVYLTGAAGNTAPSLLDPHVPAQPWRGEAGVRRSGLYLAGEAARVLAATLTPMAQPRLAHVHVELPILLRPWPAPDEPHFPNPLGRDYAWKEARTYYEQARDTWPERRRTQSPWPVRLHVLRVGDAVLCTNPAELFVEFGLALRAASPARVTLISELTDGYCGYVPTLLAYSRGGYETWPAPSSQLGPQAGPQLVRATTALLQQVFAD